MGLTLSSYYQRLNPFTSNLSRKREREEENGERGEMLTYRRRNRTSKIGRILTYYRRRKIMSNREEGGCEREKEKEIVHQSSNKRGREGGGLSAKEERPVKKERTIAPCSSPQASFITPHSTFNGFAFLNLCFSLNFSLIWFRWS